MLKGLVLLAALGGFVSTSRTMEHGGGSVGDLRRGPASDSGPGSPKLTASFSPSDWVPYKLVAGAGGFFLKRNSSGSHF